MWSEDVAIIEDEIFFSNFRFKPEERSRHRWNNNIKVETKEIVLNVVNWIQLTSNWFQWWAVLNLVMSIQLA
jgi:hypothetical protein